jgi:glycosyltransferase involved in cell wall biosynthesis
MAKLRIAFATPEFVTETYFDGGLANYVNRASKALAQRGHDVHVVTLSLNDDAEFEHEGVMVHRVTLKRGWQLINRLTRYSLPTTLHWLNFSTQVYRKLKQLHRQEPFDLIQYPNYSSCGVFSIPFLRATHVVRASSYEPAWNDAAGIERNSDFSLVHRLEKWQYRLTRNVYAPSQAMQQMLADKAGKHAALVRTPFYLETNDWDNAIYDRFLQAKKYVLYFGRFQLHKGFHLLAQGLPAFLNHYTDAYAVLVGRDAETSLASSMTAFARAKCGSSATRLIILENLPHSQLYPIIAGARLVVLPSLIDNLPNSCLEAMGLGKVVMGTRGTSFEELITDRVNGFLVKPNDSTALMQKMISAWIDPKLDEIGQAAKRSMEEFAPERTIPALLSYYSTVMNGQYLTAYAHNENQQSYSK